MAKRDSSEEGGKIDRRLVWLPIAVVLFLAVLAGACGSALAAVASAAATITPQVSISTTAPSTAATTETLAPTELGEKAYSYIEQLAVAPRVAGTAGESAAAAKIGQWFADAGYSPTMQSFTYKDKDGRTQSSQNVVAFRAATVRSGTGVTPLVIIGAHYDTVNVQGDEGADDNASGVAVMLELAERLVDYDLACDVAFVAFGVEEAGLQGSSYYVSHMSAEDISRTAAMIDLDVLIVGDKLYIQSGSNGKTQARDQMLRLIDLYNLPIQPGGWPPTGVIPDGYSDYGAFNQAGIPIVFLFSTNWGIGNHDGRTQTEKYGTFWHTSRDNLATIEELLPGRPMVRLDAYTTLVFEFLMAYPSLSERYEQTNTNIVRTGTWANFATTHASLGSYGRSSTGGASATIYFTGTRLDWIAMKGTSTGMADVYLDGAKAATIDLAAAVATYKVNVWSSGTLPSGAHTVRIERNSGSASGKYLTLDAIDIWGTIRSGP
jgi:alkaline phosphatase isozyme conversion protein